MISKYFTNIPENMDKTKENLEKLMEYFFSKTYVESSMNDYDCLRGICFPNGLCVISAELFTMDSRNLEELNSTLTSSHEICHLYKYYFANLGKNLLFKVTPRKDDQNPNKSKLDPQYRKYDEDSGEFYEEKMFGVSKMTIKNSKVADFILQCKPWFFPEKIQHIKEFALDCNEKVTKDPIYSEVSSGQNLLQKKRRVYCLFSFGEFKQIKRRTPAEIAKLVDRQLGLI